jgi:hypothetical protein
MKKVEKPNRPHILFFTSKGGVCRSAGLLDYDEKIFTLNEMFPWAVECLGQRHSDLMGVIWRARDKNIYLAAKEILETFEI